MSNPCQLPVLCAVFLALLTALVQANAQTPAAPPINEALACNAALDGRPELAPLAGKVMVTGEPKATLEMQALAARPNQAEKAAISRWASLREGCFALGATWLDAVNAPQWMRAIVMQAKDAGDANVSALYRGQVSYGEFNVKQMALAAEVRKRVDDGLEQARRTTDANQPVPAAASPAPAQAPAAPVQNLAVDRNQCEMDAARAYPVLMQQRMTDPGFQAPNQVRAQQTTCNMIGGQMVCRSNPTGVDTSIYNRPPSYVTDDVNASRRQAAFGSCMESKGYRRN